MSTPLTPLSANSHKMPTAAASPTKPTPSCAGSPSRLPQKTPAQSSPSKLKQGAADAPAQSSPLKLHQAATDAPAPSSPFMSFSPVVQSARGSRLNSPAKLNSSTKLSFDDEFDPFNDAGDESVCSNFSDVTAGAYNTASQGYEKVLQETAASARKSPVKVCTPDNAGSVRCTDQCVSRGLRPQFVGPQLKPVLQPPKLPGPLRVPLARPRHPDLRGFSPSRVPLRLLQIRLATSCSISRNNLMPPLVTTAGHPPTEEQSLRPPERARRQELLFLQPPQRNQDSSIF
jgi:hypothetical protein